MIKQKDWEEVKRQTEAALKEALISIEIFRSTIAKADDEINKYSDVGTKE